jgi:hypothetical protein
MECLAWEENQQGVFVGDSNSKQGVFVVNSDSNIAHQLISLPWKPVYILPTLAQNDHLLFLKAVWNDASDHQPILLFLIMEENGYVPALP